MRSGLNPEELDRVRIEHFAAHALGCVEMDERLVGEWIAQHARGAAFGDQIAMAEIAECDREFAAFDIGHVFRFDHGIAQQPIRLTPRLTQVRLRDPSSKPMAFVPPSALVSAPDGSLFVWRYDPDTYEVTRQSVRVQAPVPEGVPVVDGLAGGEYVVTTGASLLQEGMRVRPMER